MYDACRRPAHESDKGSKADGLQVRNDQEHASGKCDQHAEQLPAAERIPEKDNCKQDCEERTGFVQGACTRQRKVVDPVIITVDGDDSEQDPQRKRKSAFLIHADPDPSVEDRSQRYHHGDCITEYRFLIERNVSCKLNK